MLDTSPEAALAQAAVRRRLSGIQKILISGEMSDTMRALARARIKAQHPEFGDAEVRAQLVWELYGRPATPLRAQSSAW